MKKVYSVRSIVFTSVLSIVFTLFFACSFELPKKSQAIDSSPPATQAPSNISLPAASLPDFREMVKKNKPAVVNISSTKVVHMRPQMPRARDPLFDDFFGQFFGAPKDYSQNSLGSGFFINKDGTILTNNHVVQNADEIIVNLSDGRKLQAKVVGNDPKTDVAVIKIKGGGDFPTVSLGDSDHLDIGEWVMAVGNPFGLGQTVTAGIVSAKGRVIGAGPYDDFIQTDASINPGNSGGPLFNLKGEVVGINTAIYANGQGIGFAIPINVAKNLAPQLIERGKVSRGYLGVSLQELTPDLAKSFALSSEKGALVASVQAGSPADKAGLQSGDVVTAYNGKMIETVHELQLAVSQTPVGNKSSVEVLRKGEKKSFTVEVGDLEQGEKQVAQIQNQLQKESTDLGLIIRDLTPQEAQELGLKEKKGVLVVKVIPGSKAEWVGLNENDVILGINDQPVNQLYDYDSLLKKTKTGDVLKLFVKRGNATSYFAFRK